MGRYLNTGMVVTGIQQPKGYDITEAELVPYLHIGPLVLNYKRLYDFKLRYPRSLTLVLDDGTMVRPDCHFKTDQMSSPRFSRFFWDKDRFITPYFHDSGYVHKGLWFSNDCGNTWKFRPMTRKEVDLALFNWLKYEPVPTNLTSRLAIYVAVRSGGWAGFGKGDYRKTPVRVELI